MTSVSNTGTPNGSTPSRDASFPGAPDGWELFRRYENQLRRLAAAYAAKEAALGGWEVDDVVQEFALRLAQRAWTTPLLDEGAFVRASFRNFLRDWRHGRFREERALAELARSVPPPDEMQPPGQTLATVVTVLPAVQGAAAALYLGLGGTPRSVREIAEELGLTRYAARRAVIDGLLAAAAALGYEGRLQRVELDAVRLILLDGMTAAAASACLGIPETRISQALSRARDVVGASFNLQHKR